MTTIADRRLHIGTDKDAWWRPAYFFAEFQGVRCCNGHRRFDAAMDHGEDLFQEGRWAW